MLGGTQVHQEPGWGFLEESSRQSVNQIHGFYAGLSATAEHNTSCIKYQGKTRHEEMVLVLECNCKLCV